AHHRAGRPAGRARPDRPLRRPRPRRRRHRPARRRRAPGPLGPDRDRRARGDRPMSIAPTDLEADRPGTGPDAERPRGDRTRAAAISWGLVGAGAVLLAWWAVTAVGGAGSPMLAALSPWGVPQALASLLSTGVLVQDLVTSTMRLLTGLVAAAAVG